MLSNSVVAGFLASGYVLALVLQLNPSLPLVPARLLPLAATISLFYTLQLAVVFYVALVVRQLLARELVLAGVGERRRPRLARRRRGGGRAPR